MKNRILASVLCVALAAGMIACGSSKDTDNTENTESTESAATVTTGITSDKRSGEFDIDVAKQVTALADYDAVPVTLSTDYQITDEAKNSYLTQLLTTYGADAYKEITDRTDVEEGDYVKVDYTGYLDGEAFDGGSATDVLLDVSNNSAVGGSSFIDGFTSGIIGANVGDTVSSDVTFPDDYQADNLAGQEATFEFTIKAIYSTDPVTMDDLTDDKVAEIFSKANVETVADFEAAVENDLKQNAYSVTVNEVKSYMLENSEVDVPEDYLTARLAEYEESFLKDNGTDGQTLEDLLSSSYNVTLEDAESTWRESLTAQIKTEFIFGYIAQLENIEIDEDEYNNYISYIINQASGTFSEANDVYEYFGSGNAEEGEAYLRNQYLVNKAIDKVTDMAVVTYEEETTESAESVSESTEAE